MNHRKYRKNGFTLVELLLGAAIGTVAMLVAGTSMNMLNASSSKVSLISDINDIKVAVVSSMSCSQTFASMPSRPPCPPGGVYIDIKSSPFGKTLIKSSGSKIGSWTVRALCTSEGLDIRAANILPQYEAQTNTLSDWRTLSQPTNPEFYKKDHSRGRSSSTLSWSHPLAKISSPGSLGLCSEYFATTLKNQPCPSGSFVKSVDFDSNEVICQEAKECGLSGETLKFVNGKMVCSKDLYNLIKIEFEKYLENRKKELATISENKTDNLKVQIEKLEEIPASLFNPKNDYVQYGFSNQDCRKLSLMKCKDRYVMTSYEFRYDTTYSQKCSMNCRKIAP